MIIFYIIGILSTISSLFAETKKGFTYKRFFLISILLNTILTFLMLGEEEFSLLNKKEIFDLLIIFCMYYFKTFLPIPLMIMLRRFITTKFDLNKKALIIYDYILCPFLLIPLGTILYIVFLFIPVGAISCNLFGNCP